MNDEYIEYIEDNIYGNTYTALELLLINSRAIQKQFKTQTVTMSARGNLRELCTVRMAASRRSGHSSSLIKLALEYFNHAIFVTSSFHMKDSLRTMFWNSCSERIVGIKDPMYYKLDNGSEYYFLSGDINEARGMDTEAILIDGYTGIGAAEIDEIYNVGGAAMDRKPFKYFICVG